MVHTGERPYPCAFCSETFVDSKSLRRHREVSHPTAVPDPELDTLEEEEFIEPGQEEQYLPVKKEPTETEAGTEGAVDEGVADDSKNQDDTDSNEEDAGSGSDAEHPSDSESGLESLSIASSSGVILSVTSIGGPTDVFQFSVIVDNGVDIAEGNGDVGATLIASMSSVDLKLAVGPQWKEEDKNLERSSQLPGLALSPVSILWCL